MANFWTYAQIKAKIEQDLSLEDELFVEPDELLGYVNEGIREAEAEIHGLYEDYFLTRTSITLVQGQEEYAVPSNLYAMKIRRLVYVNGSEVYKMDRLRDWHKFEDYAIENVNRSSTRYVWFPLNTTVGAPTILLAPPAKTAGAYVKLWYIRAANQLTDDDSICDIPEFVNFVMQYAKKRCYEKEVGHPSLPLAVQDLEQQRQQMVSSLATMTPDADNTIEADYSSYEEMS